MTNKQQELADVLEEYATYLKLDEQDGRAMAYDRAARTIRTASYLPPNPADLDRVGDSIRTTIAKYQRSGKISELEELKEEYSWFGDLKDVSQLGPERARRIHHKFNVDDINDLIMVGDDVTMISGIGPKTAEKIMASAKEKT